ncbi:MAG: hypothetical protein J7K26_02550 [Candidatus Aenigmarchaeota archaeon]|nr:hypothetical protein [Candidatus Aenigmarchaeota archaeon]
MHTSNQNNICIIGTEKRNYTDLKLLNAAKKIFNSAFYIPITSIRLEVIENKIVPYYREKRLTEFGTVFVRVPQKYYSLAAIIIDTMPKTFKVQSSDSFRMTKNKIMMFKRLSTRGITIPKITFISDIKSAEHALKNIEFPIMIYNPTEKKVVIGNSKRESKNIIETLGALGQNIIIEEIGNYTDKMSVYVVGDKIIKGTIKGESINVPKNIKNISLDICRILNTKYAKLDFVEDKIIDVNLCPYLQELIKLDKNIVEKIMKKIDKISRMERGGIIVKFIDDIINILKYHSK